MKNILLSPRVLVLGLLSWLLPFVFSFLFFDQSGQLTIAKPLFKSLMVVVGGGIGVSLLVVAFRRIEKNLRSGIALGCYWLALNLLLDIVILIPMSGMSFADYFSEIGLRYFLIPIMAMGIGLVASEQAGKP